MVSYEAKRDLEDMATVWTFRVPDTGMVRVRLDNFDRMLLRDCEGPDASSADKLLALEMLARRMEQADD